MKQLNQLQRSDLKLQSLFETADGESEPHNVYCLKNGVLMHRWIPPTYAADDAEWATVHQIVVTKV